MEKDINIIISELEEIISQSKELVVSAESINSVCNLINNSWSGSDLVGHSNLFYGNFEIPENHRRFSVEWGLINGLPNGWNEKTPEELNKKISSKLLITLDVFNDKAEELENKFDEIRKKTVLLFAKFSREISNEVEKFNLKTKTDFFNDYWSRQIATRDSDALYSGRQVPPHKYYDATATFVLNFPKQVNDFIYLIRKYFIEVENEKKIETKHTNNYIDKKTLIRIVSIKNNDFDLSRLIELLKELDDNFSLENYYSCSMILRSVLDHIPPIFGKTNFTDVCSQYGSKSFKDIMTPLNETARKIGDNYLHTQVDKKVLKISKTQVGFQANIDVLLNEIANILETQQN